jgi:peptidase YpeB-like protein
MPTSTADRPRDLRDAWWFRVAILLAVLALAMLYVRGCGAEARKVSSEEAVRLARAEASFVPDRTQVRLVQRGLPAHSYWGVSFVKVGPDGRPERVEVFLVDAKTGEVTRT